MHFWAHLDAASAEYLAARLRRRAGQVWLLTRQPEVPGAFEADELLRLTRSSGRRRPALHTDGTSASHARSVTGGIGGKNRPPDPHRRET